MHRIDASGYAAGNVFTDGNPATGVPATVVDAAWLNNIQETLAQTIEAAGLTLAKGDYTQLIKALIVNGMQGSYFNVAAAAGTANAITASYTPSITALANGMTLYVRAGSANTTTTPTFTPKSGTIAAKTIVKGAGQALVAGDIAGGGHWIELQYDATLDSWVLLNPANGIGLDSRYIQASGATLTGALNFATPVSLASAATVNIGAAASNNVTITGTTTITAFDTIAAGAVRNVTFSGALTLTHNATSLILPGATNITTAAGDIAEFVSIGAGNWRCTQYQKADGSAVVGGGMTLLGTLTTTSGTTQTLSGLSLSEYKFIRIVVADVSNASGSQVLVMNGVNTFAASGLNNNSIWGIGDFELQTSAFSTNIGTGTTGSTTQGIAGSPFGGKSAVTSSTTSLAFTFSSGAAFDAGTIRVYGVK